MTRPVARAATALALLAATAGAARADPSGLWAMENGKVTVQVDPCGGNLCATIVGLREPLADGKPKLDRKNPDPGKRSRPVIGLSILIDMKPRGENLWQGTIYNPDDGRTYSATVRDEGERMKVKGCVAGIFCRTNVFVRTR